MAIDPSTRLTPRQIPRGVAYPAFFAIAIMCIYGGIKLGSAGVATFLMLASHNNTPVENWTLSLIALSISLSVSALSAYENRSFRFRLDSFLLVAVCIAGLFVFGAWGLYGLVTFLAIWYLVIMRRQRILRTKRSVTDD